MNYKDFQQYALFERRTKLCYMILRKVALHNAVPRCTMVPRGTAWCIKCMHRLFEYICQDDVITKLKHTNPHVNVDALGFVCFYLVITTTLDPARRTLV